MRKGLNLLLGAALATSSISPAGAASPPWPLGPDFPVSLETSAYRPAIGTNENGVAVVAWTSADKGETEVRIYARIYAADGLPASDPLLVAESLLGPVVWLDHPSVALAADGSFVVGWQGEDADGDGIRARRFAADGSPLGASFVVNQVETSGQVRPRLAAAPGGGFAAVWSSASGGAIFGRLFDAGGQPLTGDVGIATGASPLLLPDVVALGSGFVATWQRGAGGAGVVVSRRLSAGLDPVGDENPVSPSGQLAPLVAAARDGGDPFFAIVSFSQGNGVSLRRFDQDSQGVGSAEAVSGGLAGQFWPSLAFDAAGGLTAIWVDSDNQRVLGRRLAGRPPLGPSSEIFTANTTSNGFLGITALAAFPDGRLFAAWSTGEIRGRFFSSVLIFADGFESGSTGAWQ